MRFVLEIKIGNAAVETWDDVADLIRKEADKIEGCDRPLVTEHDKIHDRNGNTVGKWEVKSK
jgi:hypothetical protein